MSAQPQDQKSQISPAQQMTKENPSKSASSAVKPDPYSNKTHKRIDAVLVVITIVLMVFAFRMSTQHGTTSSATDNNNNPRAVHSQTNH
jgi:hypothetical protein